MCDNINTCYNEELAKHQTRVTTVKPVADQRTREAVLIEHIKCLLTNLKLGNTNINDCATATDANDASYQSQYNVTYPEDPDEPDCRDTSGTTPYPGHYLFPTDDNSGYVGPAGTTPYPGNSGIVPLYGVQPVHAPCAD